MKIENISNKNSLLALVASSAKSSLLALISSLIPSRLTSSSSLNSSPISPSYYTYRFRQTLYYW